MSAGTALSRLTGFLRLAATTYALGVTATRLPDAYNVANTTPNIVYELVLGGVLSSVFVPVFVEWMQTRGREEAWEAAHRVLTVALLALAAVTVAGALAAPWIIRLYTARWTPGPERDAARELAIFFLRWFMPQIVFYGLATVATGLLNAHRRFAAPMFAPILNNLVVIATMLAFAAMVPRAPVPGAIAGPERLVLAAGTTLGVAAMALALWPAVRRLGYRFAWRPDWRHPAVRRIGHLATWAVVYVAVNQLGYLVVPVLAGERRGGYTAYAAAFILFQLPHAVFSVSVITALVPAMSSRHADGDREGFRDLVSQGIRATAFVVIPAALGYIALARPITRLLLEHGETGPADTALIADVLTAFALGLFSFSVFQLLLRAFYAAQDTRTPALVNVVAVGANVGVNVLFVLGLDLGVPGLALGHATAYTLGAGILAVILRRRLGGLHGRRVAATVARVLAAAAATASTAWAVARGLDAALGTATLLAQAAQVLGAIAAGLLVFAAAALMLRIEEAQLVREAVRSRTRR